MTVSTQSAVEGPLFGDGSTEEFFFSFRCDDEDELRVIKSDTTNFADVDLVKDVNYTVALNADQDNNPGGSITTIGDPLPGGGNYLMLFSAREYNQELILPGAGAWSPRTVGLAFDRLTMQVLQLKEKVDRAILLPETDFDAPGTTELPSRVARAERAFGFDSNGDPVTAASFVPPAVPVSGFVAPVLNSADSTAFMTGLGFTAFMVTVNQTASNANSLLLTLGGGTVGIPLFEADLADDVWTALAVPAFGESLVYLNDVSELNSLLGISSYAASNILPLANQAALRTEVGISAFGATLVDDASAGAALTTLGVSAFAQTILDDANATAVFNTLGVTPFIQTLLDDADQATAQATLGITAPRGHLAGLKLSNSGGDPINDIDIAVGEATDVDLEMVMRLAGTLTKRLDAAWAVGTNQGGLDTGAIANGTYHVWLIQRSDTNVVDALFSTSATSPTMPASYDRRRRIGSIVRSAGSILAFSQENDEFLWSLSVLDVSANNPGTSAVLRTLTVPSGIKVTAIGHVYLSSTATDSVGVITSPDESDQAPSETVAPLGTVRADASANAPGMEQFSCRTNTSGQIRTRLSFSAGSTDLRIATRGWIDYRGKGD